MQGASDRLPDRLTEAANTTYFLPYIRLPYHTFTLKMGKEMLQKHWIILNVWHGSSPKANNAY
jgi:hypothetical protein